MAIKELINQVIGQLTGDGADAQKDVLRKAISEAETMQEQLIQANGEAKTRKEKVREAEAKISELNDQIEKLNNITPELEQYKKKAAELDNYKQQQYEQRLTQWTEKAKVFDVKETDKAFEKMSKAKAKFTFPADDKTPLTDEQIDANLKAYDLLDMAGFFTVTDDDKGGGFPRPGNQGNEGSGNPYANKLKK